MDEKISCDCQHRVIFIRHDRKLLAFYKIWMYLHICEWIIALFLSNHRWLIATVLFWVNKSKKKRFFFHFFFHSHKIIKFMLLHVLFFFPILHPHNFFFCLTLASHLTNDLSEVNGKVNVIKSCEWNRQIRYIFLFGAKCSI